MSQTSPMAFSKGATSASSGCWDHKILRAELATALSPDTFRLKSSLAADCSAGTLEVYSSDGEDWTDDQETAINDTVAAHADDPEE